MGFWCLFQGFGEKSLFALEGDLTLGKQKQCVNSSYFWQSRGINKIQLYGEGVINFFCLLI